MFEYYDDHGRLIAKSDSKITFNKDLFPQLAKIEPKKTTARKGGVKNTKE